MELIVTVPSLSCGTCSSKILREIKTIEGIRNAQVDLKTQTIKMEYDPNNIDAVSIKRKIMEMGYEIIQ